jgi:creatinine amidohydrolase
MKTLRSRFLAELTTPEVEAYFKRGGKTAFLPAGSVEMHGPHLPIGTDTVIAKAFSLLMARETDGIVLPEVWYSWAGATDGFAGTVSVPPQMVTELVTRIGIHCWKMGFRRFVVVSNHGRNEESLTIGVRRLYETHGVVAQYLQPTTAASPEAEKLFAGPWRAGKEASLALGALTILGREDLYSEKELAYDDPAPRQLIAEMEFKGVTGFYYQEPRHHVRPSRHTSRARAIEFFDLQVKAMAPSVKRLDAYARKARKQKNQGWGRIV